MKVTRREFIILSGKAAVGAVVLSACGVPERELLIQSSVEAPEDLVSGEDAWYATSWPDATNAEGVVARVIRGRVTKLAGNNDHPVNRGKHSTRYDAGIQTLYHPDRVKRPMFRRSRSGDFNEISWDRALDVLRGYTNNTVTTVVTNPLSGELRRVVEAYVAANNGRRWRVFDPLEQGVLQDTCRRLYGSERLPRVNIADADMVLSFGADWLVDWVSPVDYARQFGEFRSGDSRGYFTHAEARFSPTAASADLWLPVKPGYEGALALGIARVIIDEGLVSASNIRSFQARTPASSLNGYGSATVAAITGVPEEKIIKAARRFGSANNAVAFGGGSAGAHTNGSFNLTAIYALNALVGNSLLQANPALPLEGVEGGGYGDSYSDWYETELAQWRGGHNDTVIVRGADIVHGMPSGAVVDSALNEVDNVVVFSSFVNDTAARANLILPETSFLEEWGTAVPNPGPGYQTISFQQPVSGNVEYSGSQPDARSFGDVLLNLMGGLDSQPTMQRLVRRAASNLHASEGSSGSIRAANANLFLRGVLQRGGWWNVNSNESISYSAPALFDLEHEPSYSDVPNGSGAEFHLVPFKSVGILDGRLSATLWGQQVPDPISTACWSTWVEMNREQAKEMNIKQGDVVYVRSIHGEIEALAYPHPGVPRDVIGVPLGQGHIENGRYASGTGSNVFKVLVDQRDSETGALAWASTRVRVIKRGGNEKLPSIEGDVTAFPAEPGVPVLVVAPGETAHDAEHANEVEYRRQFSPGTPAETTEETEEGEEH